MAFPARNIDSAARRLAHAAHFPALAGGTYVFCDEELRTGTWLPAGHPFEALCACAVAIPAACGEAFALVEARCRILIEDALASTAHTA